MIRRDPTTGLVLAAAMMLAQATAAPGTLAAAGAATGEGRQGATLPFHLIYIDDGSPQSAQVAAVVGAMGAVYGRSGLHIVEGEAGAIADPALQSILERRRRSADAAVDFALYDAHGDVLVEDDRQDLDLHAVRQLLDERLLGIGRRSFLEEASAVLSAMQGAGDCLEPGGSGDRVALISVCGGGTIPALCLPPGCTDCMFAKYAARIGALLERDPDIPVLAFAPGTVDNLRAMGWTGALYLADTTPEAVLWSLRQSGSYFPFTVAIGPGDDVVVGPVGNPEQP